MALLAVLSVPSFGQGQAAPAAASAFEQGIRSLNQGRADEAVAAFERALSVTPTPQQAPAWLNLGIAQSRLGQPHAAVAAFDAYLRLADPARDTANVRAVQAELARLRVTSTVLVLAVQPQDASVQVDGRPLLPQAGELLLLPGEHSITLTAQGHRAHTQTVALPAGRFQFALSLEAGSEPPSAAPETALVPDAGGATPAAPGNDVATADPSSAEATTIPPPPNAGPPCLLGNVCIGPLVAIGAPNAVGGSVQARFSDYVGVNLGIDLLPKITVSGVDVSTQLLSAQVQVHPLGNGLFASLGLGVQNIVAAAERPAGRVRADLNIPVLGLGVGYIGRDGLVVGIDFSFLVELDNPPLKVVAPGEELDPTLQALLEQEADDAVKAVRDMLPFMFQLNLLRVGYLF